MIVDVILDRRAAEQDGDTAWYDETQAKNIYDNAMFFGFHDLSAALDYGDENEVKDSLCRYIDSNGYNPEIKEYIRSVKWLPEAA